MTGGEVTTSRAGNRRKPSFQASSHARNHDARSRAVILETRRAADSNDPGGSGVPEGRNRNGLRAITTQSMGRPAAPG
jgi:hypothetical protein